MRNIVLSQQLAIAAFLFLSLPAIAAASDPPRHWTAAWGTANFMSENKDGKVGAADATYRQIVHLSLASTKVRVEFSNEFGLEPLSIAAASVALSAGKGCIVTQSATALTFNGASSIIIPPGAAVISDSVSYNVPTSSDLAISLFLPAQKITHLSFHQGARATGYEVTGNKIAADALPDAQTFVHWYFLKGVDVEVAPEGGTVVAFGDSITDGFRSTDNANARWPDELARRLQGKETTRQLAVIDEGIGANKILTDVVGPSALARFSRDVLSQPGVRSVILLEGTNDIVLHLGGKARGAEYSTQLSEAEVAGMPEMDIATRLIQGIFELIEEAHSRGIKVYVGTITPNAGVPRYNPQVLAARQAVNTWIRKSTIIDGLIDFDKAIRDPAHPEALLAAYDSGDHLHPNDAGYKAMGDAIDLKLFSSR